MEFPSDRKYTPEHEWIDAEGRVGITDYAQDALGDVVFIELPEPGQTLKRGDPFGVVESVKSVSDLYSPVDGVVEAVNEVLKDHPERVNEDPYGAGWIVRLKVDSEPIDLLAAQDYRAQVEGGA